MADIGLKRVIVEWGLISGGFWGCLVLTSPLSLVAAGINGLGATIVFRREENDFWRTSGLTIVFAFWGLIGLEEDAWPLVVAIFLGAAWFAFESEGKYYVEE